MRILVFVKQVPETPDIRMDYATGNLDFKNTPAIISPFDLYAVEEALLTAEKHSGEVTVLTMGPERTREVLKEALAMGCHQAIRLWDDVMIGSDAWCTARILAAAATKLSGFDVAFFGKHAVDGETAAVAGMFARLTGARWAAAAASVAFSSEGRAVAERTLESGKEKVEMDLPVVLSMVKDANKPRYASLLGLRKAAKAEITVWGLGDLGLSTVEVGMAGSHVRVTNLASPPDRTAGEILIIEDAESAAAEVLKILTNLGR